MRSLPSKPFTAAKTRMTASIRKNSPTCSAPISSRPPMCIPAPCRPLRALLRQRILYVWRRSDLLAPHPVPSTGPQPPDPAPEPVQSRSLGKTTAGRRGQSPAPVGPAELDMTMIRHYDEQITALETQLKPKRPGRWPDATIRPFAKRSPALARTSGWSCCMRLATSNVFPPS